MKCENCGAAVPRGSSVCPACGVFAGDRPPVPPASGERRRARGWIVAVVLIAIAGAGGWWWYTRYAQIPPFDAAPSHVMVKGTTKEGKAVVALRYHLVTELKLVTSECLAVIGHGYSNGYYSFDAVDSCQHAPLGHWKVDAITFKPSRT